MSEGDRRTVEEALRSRWSSSGDDWRTYNLSRSRARELVNEELAPRIPEANLLTNDGDNR